MYARIIASLIGYSANEAVEYDFVLYFVRSRSDGARCLICETERDVAFQHLSTLRPCANPEQCRESKFEFVKGEGFFDKCEILFPARTFRDVRAIFVSFREHLARSNVSTMIYNLVRRKNIQTAESFPTKPVFETDLFPSNVIDVSRRRPESMIGVIFFSSFSGSFSSLKCFNRNSRLLIENDFSSAFLRLLLVLGIKEHVEMRRVVQH